MYQQNMRYAQNNALQHNNGNKPTPEEIIILVCAVALWALIGWVSWRTCVLIAGA